MVGDHILFCKNSIYDSNTSSRFIIQANFKICEHTKNQGNNNKNGYSRHREMYNTIKPIKNVYIITADNLLTESFAAP